MKTEVASYVMTPSPHTDEMMLTTSCRRAAALARLMAKRIAQPNGGHYRYYFTSFAARRWQMLLDAGWHVVGSGKKARLTLTPKPVKLAKALALSAVTHHDHDNHSADPVFTA